MGIKDTPSFKHLDEQMRSLKLLLRANRMLRCIGLGSRKLEELQSQLDEIQVQMQELVDYSQRFNSHFSKDGWLTHGRLDFAVIKRAVDEFERNGSEEGTRVLLDHYAFGNIGRWLFLLNQVEALKVRSRLIDLAFEDYCASRYHAVVPVLLMLIDGAVNDVIGKGFHAQNIDLNVWDSITAADGAINDIKSIFQQSRRKTRTESIQLPYRNGILHGMDLGYDNEIVAAKCWSFLFVIADWISDKKSESQRQQRFAEETRAPSLRELIAQIAETKRMKQAVEEWTAREFDEEQLETLSCNSSAIAGTPEETVLKFLEFWKKRNYGEMASLYWAKATADLGRRAGEVRDMFKDVCVDSCIVKEINDEAAAITQVRVLVNPKSECQCHYMFRLDYETESGKLLARGLSGGIWRIVWVHPCEQLSSE